MVDTKLVRSSGVFILSAAVAWGQIITTVAGTSWFFPTNVPAVNTPLAANYAVVTDSSGNLYVGDEYHAIVVKITPAGILTIVAGNGAYGFSGDGGPATSAGIGTIRGLALDAAGNIYLADTLNRRIRKVTSSGIISTVAGNGEVGSSGDGGPATSASFHDPSGLAVDQAGNLYIADYGDARVRKVTPDGTISALAGTGSAGFSGDGGPATRATLNSPWGLALDAAGDLYIADWGNNRVRMVSTSGTISTVAGTGVAGFSGDGGLATSARLSSGVEGIDVDSAGNLYIADSGNNRIRRVTPAGIISTVAGGVLVGFSGDGGAATNAALNLPLFVASDAGGNLYVADFLNSRIRRIGPTGNIRTVAGNGLGLAAGDGGPATSASLHESSYVAVDSGGNLYIADALGQRVRKVTPTGIISTVAGDGHFGLFGDSGAATMAGLRLPEGVAVDPSGNLYIADSNNDSIRKVTPSGIISTVAGNGTAGYSGDGGPATGASLNFPYGVALDTAGNLFIADDGNNRVRKVAAATGMISTVAGNGKPGFDGDGGAATSALLNSPNAVVVDKAGNLYIADFSNARVRMVSPGGAISTVAGNGSAFYAADSGPATSAGIGNPTGLALDSAGNLYIASNGGDRVLEVTPNGSTSIVAGRTGGVSGDGGPATDAGLSAYGVAVDGAGNLYIADRANNRIRAVLNSPASLNASPISLSFTAPSGATAPPPQAVSLSSSITGTSFTVTSSAPWLSATPSAGSVPASLQVSANPASLTPGSYQGTITISAPLASPSTTTIAVSFTVQAPLPAQLSVGSRNLSFVAVHGGAAQTRQVQIYNSGAGTLTVSASSNTATGGAWLSVSTASGRATASSPASLTVTANPGSLATGTYQGSIVILATDASGQQYSSALAVTLSVSSAGATMLLSQSGLAFTAVAQGGTPLPQTFGILNTGQGSMNWSATSTTLSGGSNWLKISPGSGAVTQPILGVSTVSVSINPTGLDAGNYYGQIQVSSSAVNSPQLLTVVLTVLQAGASLGPEVRPAGLIFTGAAGTTPGPQNVTLGNPNAELDSYQSASIGTGFAYLPISASVLPNQPAALSVSPDFTTLQPGAIDHGGITLLFSDGTLRTISVLNVVAPQPSTTASIRLGPQASSCSSKSLEVQWREPLENFAAVLGQPTTLEVQVVDDCGNLIGPSNPGAASIGAAFSNQDADLKLTHVGNGVWTGTWKPVKPASSQVTATVTAFYSTGQVLQSGQSSLSGTLSTSSTPTVTAGGVVHAASAVAGVPIAPGSLITIYGSNLADAQGLASTLPLPQSQSGAQVFLGNLPLPILYTSSGQLNVQVPFSTPVNTNYQLSVQRDSLVSLPEQLVVAEANPGVFTVNEQGTGQGVIFKSDGVTLAQAGTPANQGETVVIYCTGLGPVSPPVPDGAPAPPSPLSNTVNAVTVTIGGQNAPVSFSGLTPGYPGLYQINALVPNGVSGVEVPVVVMAAGQTSPPVTLAVQ